MKEKNNLYAVFTGIFCASLIISNVLAFKTISLLGVVLPAAVIIFPIVYIVNDTMTEVFGYSKAKIAIFTGFIMNAIAVLAYNIAIIAPYPEYFSGQDSFSLVLGSSARVFIASITAYLIGSLANAKIMDKMKNGKSLMARCVFSTLCGEGLDAMIFITIAFVGTMPITELIKMIIAQAIFKTVYEIIAFPITNIVIKNLKKSSVMNGSD